MAEAVAAQDELLAPEQGSVDELLDAGAHDRSTRCATPQRT
jgi:hypothetical protein